MTTFRFDHYYFCIYFHNHHHLSLLSITTTTICHYYITSTICHYYHNHHHQSLLSSQPQPSIHAINISSVYRGKQQSQSQKNPRHALCVQGGLSKNQPESVCQSSLWPHASSQTESQKHYVDWEIQPRHLSWNPFSWSFGINSSKILHTAGWGFKNLKLFFWTTFDIVQTPSPGQILPKNHFEEDITLGSSNDMQILASSSAIIQQVLFQLSVRKKHEFQLECTRSIRNQRCIDMPRILWTPGILMVEN